jgi:hypothetical protein
MYEETLHFVTCIILHTYHPAVTMYRLHIQTVVSFQWYISGDPWNTSLLIKRMFSCIFIFLSSFMHNPCSVYTQCKPPIIKFFFYTYMYKCFTYRKVKLSAALFNFYTQKVTFTLQGFCNNLNFIIWIPYIWFLKTTDVKTWQCHLLHCTPPDHELYWPNHLDDIQNYIKNWNVYHNGVCSCIIHLRFAIKMSLRLHKCIYIMQNNITHIQYAVLCYLWYSLFTLMSERMQITWIMRFYKTWRKQSICKTVG